MEVDNCHSDLEMVIFWSCLVDDALRELLTSFLRDSNGRVNELLMPSNRGRVLALCLRLINEVEYNDLRLIGSVRNRFAHDVPTPSFSSGFIRSYCSKLSTCVSGEDSRRSFLDAAMILNSRLRGRSALVSPVEVVFAPAQASPQDWQGSRAI